MKIIYKIIAFVILFSVISCESFLDLEPENDIIQGDYWQTESHVNGVMMSSYVTLRDAHKQIFDWGEMRSDALEFSMEYSEPVDTWYVARRGLINENFGPANWAAMYKIIGYSNLLLKNIPDVMDRDSEFKPGEALAYIAEAKTLRALAYFYLVRTFREVPLILTTYETDGNEMTVAKSSEEVILNQIITDLNEAIPNMRSSYVMDWESFGRVTKLLATTLLADVYLYSGNYSECIELSSTVINSGDKVLIKRNEDLEYIPGPDEDPDDIKLNNSWLDIFFEENSNESIFELQFADDENVTNQLFTYFRESDSDPRLVPNPVTLEILFPEGGTDSRKAIIDYERDYSSMSEGEPEHFLLKYVGFRSASGSVTINTSLDRNFIIYRLAEVYLMRAEAYACLGVYDKAEDDINVLRMRANAGKISVKPSKNAFEDLILLERGRELIAEGKSWFDLLRIARRNNYERKDILIEKLLLNVDAVDKAAMESMLQEPNAYYLPIHKNELQLNNLLVQNPYYK